MREFVRDFQTVTKQVPGSAQENIEIKIKDYNNVIIFNNTTSNLISWDNDDNYILPMGFVELSGDTDQYIYGKLVVILFEQVLGYPAPKAVVVKKRYINATV